MRNVKTLLVVALLATAALTGCAKKAKVTEAPAVAPAAAAAPATPATPQAAPQTAGASVVTEAGLERIHFEFDSYTLDDAAKRILGMNAEWLKANPAAKITVEGHCDERGSDTYNLALGENRAKAAQAFLTTVGIAADRINVISYGEEKPLDPTSTEAAWSKNRRAEFVK
ncbi:MAG: peptidoglycan-associated lipoprotein Pal [Trichloromonadaceae bacterium]